MKYSQLELLAITRKNILTAIEGLTDEQLNRIPTGFNNNIFWNVAHLLVTQQLLHFGLSGNDLLIEKGMIDAYRKGTKPTADASSAIITFVKENFLPIVERTDRLLQEKDFSNFNPYTTSFNVTLSSIEDALTFNNIHEGLHFGYILALRKLI